MSQTHLEKRKKIHQNAKCYHENKIFKVITCVRVVWALFLLFSKLNLYIFFFKLLTNFLKLLLLFI